MFCHTHGIQSDIPWLSANQHSGLEPHSLYNLDSRIIHGGTPITQCGQRPNTTHYAIQVIFSKSPLKQLLGPGGLIWIPETGSMCGLLHNNCLCMLSHQSQRPPQRTPPLGQRGWSPEPSSSLGQARLTQSHQSCGESLGHRNQTYGRYGGTQDRKSEYFIMLCV